MRTDFVAQLPVRIPADKQILVVGNKDAAARIVKEIAPIIDSYNQDQQWIRFETRPMLPDTTINEKIVVVLMIQGVIDGTCANMKTRSRNLGICCIKPLLSKNELKHALEVLQSRRQIPVHANGSSGTPVNGNHAHVDRRQKEAALSVPQPSDISPPTPEISPDVSAPAEEKPSVVDETAQELNAALTTLGEFQAVAEKLGNAMITLTDSARKAVDELREAHKQMKAKDADYRRLQEENTNLRRENVRLENIIATFRSAFEKAGV